MTPGNGKMGGMSRIPLVSRITAPLLGLLAAGTLSACGALDQQSGSSTPKAKYPLTVNRVGGVAGFTDSLSIEDDGDVLALTTHGQVKCTLDDPSLAVLNEAGLQVKDADQPDSSATGVDQLEVFFGAGKGALRIDDARVAKAEPVVTRLLADITGPKANRKICT